MALDVRQHSVEDETADDSEPEFYLPYGGGELGKALRNAFAQPPAIYVEALDRVGAKWRERIVEHIANEIDRELREGGPAKPPTGEQAALVFIREQAQKIEGYGEALKQAAEWLKAKGEGYKANQIYQVYMHAREEVVALRGSDG